MPLDTRIALGVNPVQLQDPNEVQAKRLQLRQLVMANQQAEQAQAEQQAMNDAYRGSLGANGQLDRTQLLGTLAQRGLGSRIPALQKQFTDTDAAQTKLSTEQFDLAKKRLDASGAALSSLLSRPEVTHDDVINTVAGMVQNNLMDPEHGAQLVRSLPGRPEALRPFLMEKGLQVLDASKRMELMLPKVGTIDQGNQVQPTNTDQLTGKVTPSGPALPKTPEGYTRGPDGRMVIDPGYLAGKKEIAKAGATSLQINTAKPLLNTMAEELGKQLDSGLSGAQAARGTIESAINLRKLLNDGKLITGPGADTRVLLTRWGQALGIGGKDTGEVLANTTSAVQEMAKAELNASQGMKGQGAITESERAIIKRAASGDINMSAPELLTLSRALEKNARQRIAQHQSNVDRLKAIPEASALIPFYSGVQAPPEVPDPVAAPPAAAKPALPAGWSITPVPGGR